MADWSKSYSVNQSLFTVSLSLPHHTHTHTHTHTHSKHTPSKPHTCTCSYQPRKYYEANPELKKAIDMIHDGFFSPDAPDLFHDLTYHLLHHDT